MPKQQTVPPQLLDMVDNLYLLGRQTRAMESSPRHYGGHILVYHPKDIVHDLQFLGTDIQSLQQFLNVLSVVLQVIAVDLFPFFSRIQVAESGVLLVIPLLDHSLLLQLSDDCRGGTLCTEMINQDVLRRYRERGAGDFLEKED